MTFALTTTLLFKDENHSYQTFNQKAGYLLELSGEKTGITSLNVLLNAPNI